MEEKIKIGIDIDEVLAELTIGLIDFYNKKYDKNFKAMDINDIHLENFFNISNQEMSEVLEDFTKEEGNLKLMPLENSQVCINSLNDCELYAISARPKSIQDDTVKWIEKHYKNCFKEIHTLSDSHGVANFDKGEFANSLDIKIFIEDSLNNALNISSYGIYVILLDKPWNQEENLPENIFRVKDWNSIIEKIDILKNNMLLFT